MKRWAPFLLAMVFYAVIWFRLTAIDSLSMLFFAAFVVATAIPEYFELRRKLLPSESETWLAFLWIWFRRLICFCGALLMGAAGIALFTKPIFQGSIFEQRLTATLMLVSALVVAYVGAVGAGNKVRSQGNRAVRRTP